MMRVAMVADIVGTDVIFLARPAIPKAAGKLAKILTSLNATTDAAPGPAWVMHLEMQVTKDLRRKIGIELAPFFSANEYDSSCSRPHRIMAPMADVEFECDAFFFRDRFFLTERLIGSSAEEEEAVLRIKKLTYESEGEIVALRSYVANVEAAIEYQRSGPRREPIPDDVKLVVWSRDGGVCTRCGSNERLHFDHIIPVVKGGGNDSNNIQLLCQVCNLKKSDRIAF